MTPLEILVVPHAVIEWQRKQGLLMEQHFGPELAAKKKAEKEKGKWAIFSGKIRPNQLFGSKEEAEQQIYEMVKTKREAIIKGHNFTVKQL